MKSTKLRVESLESRQMMAAWSPGLRISDATVDEGGMATLTITRDDTSYLSASVKWATSSGTAGSGDYAAASGTLKFGSRELSKTIQIQTKDDLLVEGLESFVVNLSSAKYGTIRDGKGVVTIRDNDVVTDPPDDPPTDPPTDPPPAPTGTYGPRAISQPAGSRTITSISNLPSDPLLWLRFGNYTGTIKLQSGQRLIAEAGTVLNLGSNTLTIPTSATIENLDIRGGRPLSEWGASVNLSAGAKLLYSKVTDGTYAGVSVGTNAVLKYSDISYNRRTGIIANNVNDGIVQYNDVHHNNPTKAFDPFDEAGGSKFWNTKRFDISYNRFRDNIGNGIWLDFDNIDYVIRHNQTSDNTLAGIFLEIGYTGLVEYNVGTRDGEGYNVSGWGNGAAIVIENSSGTSSNPLRIRNNTAIDCTNGIMIIHVSGRSEETHGGNYRTEWIEVTDNVLANSGKNGWVGDRPSNVTWLRNTLSGNSRLVGGF